MTRYSRTTLLLALSLALLVAAANWLVNPYLMFHSPVITGVNQYVTECYYKQLLFKPYEANTGKLRSVIIGTSHAGIAFNPNYLAQPSYNMAVGGASSYINWRLLQETVVSNSSLDYVLLEIPFFSFNSDDPDNSPNHDSQFENRLRNTSNASSTNIMGQYIGDRLASLLSWEVSRASLKMLSKQQEIASKERGSFIANRDGQWEQQAAPTRHTWALFENSWKKFLYNEWFPAPQYRFTLDEHGQPLRYFRQSVALLYDRNIRTDIVIAPLHASLLIALHEAGLWPTFNNWKKVIVQINEEEAVKRGKTPFAIVDYANVNPYTIEALPASHDSSTRLQWFNDAAHASPVLGDAILQTLSNRQSSSKHFNLSTLNSRNIDSKLQSDKTALDNYINQNAQYQLIMRRLIANSPVNIHYPIRQTRITP